MAPKQTPAARREGKGYKVTSNQIDAIFGGLLSTGAGMAGELTASQARDLAAISRVAGRSAAKAKGSVERAEDTAINRYGTAMSGAVETAFAPSEAAAKATGVRNKAAAGAARMTAKAGQLALDIQQSAAQEAKYAADYAAAVALSERVRARTEAEEADTGSGSQSFQSASQALSEAATTLDYAGAQALVSSFKYTYGLGPKAMGKLQRQLDALYPTTDPEGLSSINTGEVDPNTPTNQFGEPYVWSGSVYQTQAKKRVAQTVNMAIAGKDNPLTNEPWTLADLKEAVLALWTAEDGSYTVPNSIIEAALAYAEHVWNNNLGAIQKTEETTQNGARPAAGGLPPGVPGRTVVNVPSS